jgi:hypothetical protein
MKELLQPLDTIVDRYGDGVIYHWDTGISTIAYSSPDIYSRALDGQITAQEYAEALVHRNDIRVAYEQDKPLPDGASIVPPTEQQVLDHATILSADMFYRAIKNARRGLVRVQA